MNDILLVYPPYRCQATSLPLGIGYITSILEKSGYSVSVCDMQARKISVSDFKKILSDILPKVVGISFMTPMYNEAVALGKLAKEFNPHIHVIAGGPHVSALPAEILEEKGADYVVIGEGELTTLELVNYLIDSGGNNIHDIKGIAYRESNQVQINPRRELIQDLDSLPFPAWHLFDIKDYSLSSLGGESNTPVFPLLTSRGCPNQCIFCGSNVVHGRNFRFRSAENVYQEIRYLFDEFGARQFDFVDDSVTVRKDRILKLCEYLSNINVNWMCNSRVNTVSEELLALMAKSGCKRIDFGVETGNPDVLKLIKKGINLKQAELAHLYAKKAGITVSTFFMVGNLGETFEHVKNTANFVQKLDTDYPSVTICTPFPGTELYDICQKNNLLYETDWGKYITAPHIMQNYKPVASNGIMSQKELLDAYYYLNRKFLKKKLNIKYGKHFYIKFSFFKEVVRQIKARGLLSLLVLIRRLILSNKSAKSAKSAK